MDAMMQIDKLIAPSRRGRFTAPTADLSASLLVAGLPWHRAAPRLAPINGLMGAVNRPLRLLSAFIRQCA